MNAKQKSNSVVTTRLTPEGNLEFTVLKGGDGGTNAVFTLNMGRVAPANRARAMLHGFTQRIVDKAAIGHDPKTGVKASPASKARAMQDLVAHYESGSEDWSPARAQVIRVEKLDSILLAAVVEATGRTETEIREKIQKGAGAKGVSESAYLAALGSGERVAPIVERLREEQAEQAGVDGDEELDALMEGTTEEEGEDDSPEIESDD